MTKHCSDCDAEEEEEKERMNIPHKCPVCNGTSLVSTPPGVAGDLESWDATGTAPYNCSPCEGTGVLWREELAKHTFYTPWVDFDNVPRAQSVKEEAAIWDWDEEGEDALQKLLYQKYLCKE